MTSPSPFTKATIWIWPTGLFPRRLIYYLRAKRITTSTLIAHNIHLIPVTLSMPAGLVTKPGYEPRPDGLSLPCMRVEQPDGSLFWVRESLAIIGWLEDVFGKEKGYDDIRGNRLEQRAKTADIMSVFADAMSWSGTSLIHSDLSTLSWSGMSQDQMSASAAVDAKRRFHLYLSRLEGWVESDVIGKETKSVSGEGANVTLADIVVMTMVMYTEDAYKKDWLEEHGVLRVWCERAKKEAWFVGIEELKRCEEGGWEVVLGK